MYHMLGFAMSLELCCAHCAVAVDGSGECGQGLLVGDHSLSRAVHAIRESACNAMRSMFSARSAA
jgi:hypothetical protein